LPVKVSAPANVAKVPVVVGSVSVGVPAAAATVRIAVPLVVPLKFIAPVVPLAVPTVIVEAKVGAVPNTRSPVPVSSEITPASSAEVVAAKSLNLLAVKAMVPPASGKLIALGLTAVEEKVVALLPLPRTKPEVPVEAVRTPALVMVPEPVVEILLEVLIVLAVAIVPNPLAIDPEARAPTVVKLEVTTLEARVVPEILAAALTVIEASGRVITRVPLVEAPVILKFIVVGVPEVPAK
jgi:hypothetical protein